MKMFYFEISDIKIFRASKYFDCFRKNKQCKFGSDCKYLKRDHKFFLAFN